MPELALPFDSLKDPLALTFNPDLLDLLSSYPLRGPAESLNCLMSDDYLLDAFICLLLVF